ncbi:MAG: insulinase family protein [Acidimicrobiia bacterium]|nr:insulinase family protein [Acidimicrobiia bacterium]
MRADRSRLPRIGPDPAFAFPEIVRHTLGNGLQVRTVEHTTVPVVTFVLLVDGGAAGDPRGREGLAAITADMVDEGTGGLTAIDVSDALARLGAVYDADVGADATTFMLMTLSRFAARGATLLADLVTRPALTEPDFSRVRQLRLDRLKQMKDLAPAVAERTFLRLMYGDHPYGHLAIGTADAVGATSRDEVEAFHRRTFRPRAATLVVAGAHTHAELLDIADRAFGAWPDEGGETPLPHAPIGNGARPGARIVIVPREGAAQSEMRIGHLAVARNTPSYHALLVMNAVLGGQFVSRVNMKLREEKGYTYGARTGFDWRRGIAPFYLQASVHTAATADAVRDSLAELDAIRGSRPASSEELELAKASLTRGYPRNFETAQQVARSVAQLALYGLPDTYFEEFVPTVHAVTVDEVSRVAQQYIDPARATTLVVGDHAAVSDPLGALGLGLPQVVPP